MIIYLLIYYNNFCMNEVCEEKSFAVNERVWVRCPGTKDSEPMEQGIVSRIVMKDDEKSYQVRLVSSKSSAGNVSVSVSSLLKVKCGKDLMRRQQQRKQMERVVAKSRMLQQEDKRIRSSKKSVKKDYNSECGSELQLDEEIARFLSLSKKAVDQSDIEGHFKMLRRVVEARNPRPENIQLILSGANGANLMNVVRHLDGRKGFERVAGQARDMVRGLKEHLLRFFFDPADIIQQLDQVYKSDGHKKTQKLFEKISAQQDCIELNDGSEHSDESPQKHSKTASSSGSRSRSSSKKKPQNIRRKHIAKTKKRNAISSRRLRKLEESPSQNSTDHSQVADPQLRKKVCIKLLLLLSKLKFSQDKGKELSVKLEQLMRKQHPRMGASYTRLYTTISKNLEQLDDNIKEQLSLDSVDSLLWTTLCRKEEPQTIIDDNQN